MRPLIAAEPMFLAPKPEIVSESNLTAVVGVCADTPITKIKLKTVIESRIIFFIFFLIVFFKLPLALASEQVG